MSTISKEEVKHIAKLARLELTEVEIEKMQKDMSAILDYFNLLQKAPKPAEDVKTYGDITSTRKDEAISNHNIVDELIGAAPDKKDDYIKVNSILQ
jgi:aspartyl-tRNA(Asn)/glutamyl-tRNA(Gln) amidotransferase subunit C